MPRPFITRGGNVVYKCRAEEIGFSDSAIISAALIECEESIRALCAPDKCGNHGSSWVCPPGCGRIESCRDIVASYGSAMLLQSVHENVDYTDKEKMHIITREHNKAAMQLFNQIRAEQGSAYLLTTGGCDLCEKCTFPDEPCRIPDKNRGSLSAFGVNVGKLCEAAKMEYSFTEGILRMVACILY